MRVAYQHLLDITSTAVRQPQQLGTGLRVRPTQAGQQLSVVLDHVVPLVCQVVTQTTRRVIQEEDVSAS